MDDKLHFLIISPKFHPVQDGLGGHTTKFCQNLSKFHQVDLLTSKPKLEEGHNYDQFTFSVHREIPKWSLFSLLKSLKKIKEIAPDIILLQYLPFLYTPRGGINFSIVLFMIILKFIFRYRIEILCHELFYPFQWNIKAIIMHFAHKTMLSGLLLCSDTVFSTTENFTKILKKSMFSGRKNISHLPVGSNITFYDLDVKIVDNFCRSNNIGENELVIGLFGSNHPSKNYPMLLECLSHLINENEFGIKIIFIGQKLEEIKKYLPWKVFSRLKKSLIVTGKLDDQEINIAMDRIDIMISYFEDGISSRRGSSIAALMFGIPMISTKTEKTDKIFLNQKFIKLLDPNPNRFKNQLINELANHNDLKRNRKELQDLIKTFYINYFSWDVIIKEFLDAQ